MKRNLTLLIALFTLSLLIFALVPCGGNTCGLQGDSESNSTVGTSEKTIKIQTYLFELLG